MGRLFSRLVFKLLYRVEVRGLENYKVAGGRALIIANHASLMDGALLSTFLPDPLLFAIDTSLRRSWWGRFFAVPSLDPSNPMTAKTMFDALRQDRRCMIFPEGRVTTTGAIMKTYDAPGMIADMSDAALLPVRIEGSQYTPFSCVKGKHRIRLFPKITLTIMPPRRLGLPKNIPSRKRRELAGAKLYDIMAEMMLNSSPLDATLMQTLIDARAIHGSRKIIVEDAQRKPLSYGDFITNVLVLGRLIKRATGKDEKYIGFMFPTTVRAALTFFAIQSLERVSVMMNFVAGVAALTSAAKTSTIKTLVTSEQFVAMAKLGPVIEALKNAGVRILYLEDLQKTANLSDKIFAFCVRYFRYFCPGYRQKAESTDPAVMLFTSGSEGAPKGVLHSHRSMLANKYQLSSILDLTPKDVAFSCLPVHHSFGFTCGMTLPLFSGIRTYFHPAPLQFKVVPEIIYDVEATVLFATNTFLTGYANAAHPYDLRTLRFVVDGGEPLRETTRKLWFDKFGIRVLEGYGVTETAPVIGINTFMHNSKGSIGRALPGIQVRLDPVEGIEDGKLLVVKGPNNMMGYVKEDAPGVLKPLVDNWHDTGDIVSVDEMGFITIKGRAKRFAKIGGEMISLSAVEAAISALWPDGKHAVVSVPDKRKGETIALLTEYPDADMDTLHKAFRERGITELSLPRHIIKVEKVPLFGTGKTDYVTARNVALEKILQGEA